MLALSMALCAGLARAEPKMSDLELTWYKGALAVPDMIGSGTSFISDAGRMQRLAGSGRKFPVVVYMHGCDGLHGVDRKLMTQIARQGYIVVAPDSMKRKLRPLQCNTWSRSSLGGNYFVFDFRQEEINFAVQALKIGEWAQWTDTDNMFLVGVSEGGLAVAHFRGDVFKARVITQWTCHGSTWVRGISGPEDTPILAIVRKNDPWYKDNPKQAGDCGAFFGDKRPGSESVLLEKGDRHEVLGEPEVTDKIISFLARYNTHVPQPPAPPRSDRDYPPLR